MSLSATLLPATAAAPRRHPDAPAPGSVLGPHYHSCFGCGDRQADGLGMRVVAEEGVRVTAEFLVRDAHQGAPGLAHGGVLAAAFDEALGAALWLLRRPAVTARLETDFVRPVPVGSLVRIAVECVGVSGRKIYCRAEARVADVVVGRAAALFVMVPLAHFTAHAPAAFVDAANETSYHP